MSDTAAIKQPTKGILRQVHTQPASSAATSWFTTQQPRINSLFGSFRKNQQQESQQQQQEQTNVNAVNAELQPRHIRRVRFPVSHMTSEYVFTKEDLITERKKQLPTIEPMNIQTSSQLLSLYEFVCRNKQEPTIDLFVSTLITQPQATFLTRLDLTNQPIDRFNIAPLADIMCVDFGLRELVFNHCGLEDDAVKILMSSLLENDKIQHLSLANNPKLTNLAFKYIAIYIKGASQLASLDLSSTQPDKKSIQYLTAATLKHDIASPIPSLSSLLLNGCNLRAPQLEALATSIRKSNTSLHHLSIRGNRIGVQGALAIGVMLRDYDNRDTAFKGIERLFLDNNDLSQGGIQYIAQALRRNQSLRYLSMCECKIDAKDCILLGEALKYNQYLERFDIGYNPLMTPNMDGITSIRQALNVNQSLKDLCLADVGLSTEAAIALAECLPENSSLVRLDLSRNPNIQIAGLLALSVSIKMNHTITFIDINIPKEDKDMVEIHNGILAACTKNAQSKKSKTEVAQKEQSDNPMVTTAQATARLTLQERLAAVTKGKPKHSISTSSSEVNINQPPALPKRRTENKDSLLIQQAFDDVAALEDVMSGRLEEKDKSDTLAAADRCKEEHAKICLRIPEVTDPSHLELLLAINDRLTVAIQSFEEKQAKELEALQAAVKEQQLQMERLEEEQKAQKEAEEKLSSSFEIGDDDDDDDDSLLADEDDNSATTSETPLQVLRSEIEAEESAAFLNAKKEEGSESDESLDSVENNQEDTVQTEASKSSESVADKDVDKP
ncbi:hypothetical protein V8B55DRAFT_1468399 [Mucor lusitanicus]|uniref:RNI-like protein n=2 Tax=Mucor circinelloides f. lusitanicus TaxID=29924 RepID=A0A168JB07_MUCCL|nr:hypothetical protein FB192DRAFT_1357264 [Mucor lusitanicus]OAD00974.1 hypothetical protein MUCCIDRAFT_84898 [Mucor lusitanicus CBS 277.49]